MPRRVYVLESVLPFGEDSRHEFKGHRCLSVEELPKSSFIPGTLRRSKKAISRYVVVDVGQVQYPTSAAVWQQKKCKFLTALCIKCIGTPVCYRTLNGFLNTGQGGTVYLGVLDDGTVKGLPMSQFQVNHSIKSGHACAGFHPLSTKLFCLISNQVLK